MKVNDFEMPAAHPSNMLAGYERAYEKESVLAWILKTCIAADDCNLSGVVFIDGSEKSEPSKYNRLARYEWPGLKRVIVYCFDQIPEAAVAACNGQRIVCRCAAELLPSNNP